MLFDYFEDQSLPITPIVSVWLLTFNHKNFFEISIKSILSQKTNFDYEIVIGDDCSSDGTRDIVFKYYKSNPSKVRLILSKKNYWEEFGPVLSLELYKSCRGKYIATCEGDDYWTDPYKLQKQVDYLEANPDCSICTHWVKTKKENGEPFDEELVSGRIRPQIINSNNMFINNGRETLKGIPFMSLSIVARKKCFEFTSKIIKEIPGGDNAIWVNALEHGYAYCIPEYMGVYRKHGTSTWSSLNSTHKNIQMLVNLLYIKKYYQKYSKRINLLFDKELKEWSEWHFNHTVYKDFTKSIFHFMKGHPLFFVTLLKFFVQVSFAYLSRNFLSFFKIKLGLIRRSILNKVI